MRKTLHILLIALTFVACAPERRLARFLQNHPELQSTRIVELHDTVTIHDTIILQPDTQTINLTLQQILAMDSAASSTTAPFDTNLRNCTTERVETKGAGAELAAKGKGVFQLSTYTKKDTIIIHDTVPVKGEAEIPEYTTKVKKIPVVVHEQTWWQKILSWLGAALIAWLLIKLGIFIASKFIKPV